MRVTAEMEFLFPKEEGSRGRKEDRKDGESEKKKERRESEDEGEIDESTG